MLNSQSRMLDLSIEELESMDSPLWGEIIGATLVVLSVGAKVGLIVAAT